MSNLYSPMYAGTLVEFDVEKHPMFTGDFVTALKTLTVTVTPKTGAPTPVVFTTSTWSSATADGGTALYTATGAEGLSVGKVTIAAKLTIAGTDYYYRTVHSSVEPL